MNATTRPPPPPAPEGLSAADAEWFSVQAEQKRALAEAAGGPVSAAQLEAEADGLEALAATLRDPAAHGLPALRRGRGGEVAPAPHSDMDHRRRDVAETVASSPSLLAAEGSLERLDLARAADVLAMAAEVAEDAGAETAAAKSICHQLAAAHQLTMKLLTAGSRAVTQHASTPSYLQQTTALNDAARTSNAAARLMVACQGAALALDRLKNGARQNITVQHIDVRDGGQAVVQGNVATDVGTRGRGRGSK
jgi:hypothetical protein